MQSNQVICNPQNLKRLMLQFIILGAFPLFLALYFDGIKGPYQIISYLRFVFFVSFWVTAWRFSMGLGNAMWQSVVMIAVSILFSSVAIFTIIIALLLSKYYAITGFKKN